MDGLKLIASGGYGKIFATAQDTIIKAFRKQISPEDALNEFKFQEIIYSSINKLLSSESDDAIVNLVRKYVVVSKPLDHKMEPVTINSVDYSCYFEMEKLHGFPLSMYKNFNSQVDANIDKKYLETHNQYLNILLHLSFNLETTSGFYSVDYKNPISESNPMRGYFISKDDPNILQYLRENFNLELSDINLKHIIGFLFSWIYYDTKIIPFDVEIALGFNPDTQQFQINLLDFGLVKHGCESSLESEMELDMYADIDDPDIQLGWNCAKQQ